VQGAPDGDEKGTGPMAEAAFNMIAETRRLRDAGLPQEQAEAVTLAIHAGVTGGVATKADVEAFRGDVNRDIEALRGDVRRLDTRIDAQSDRIVLRLGVVMAATAAALFAALRYLPPPG